MRRVLIAILLLIPVPSVASEQPLWIMADGVSYQGEMDTLHEVKEMARRDAQNRENKRGNILNINYLKWIFNI